MTTGNDRFRVEKAGAVANVTLCTPDEGNTLGPPDTGELGQAVRDEVYAVICAVRADQRARQPRRRHAQLASALPHPPRRRTADRVVAAPDEHRRCAVDTRAASARRGASRPVRGARRQRAAVTAIGSSGCQWCSGASSDAACNRTRQQGFTRPHKRPGGSYRCVLRLFLPLAVA